MAVLLIDTMPYNTLEAVFSFVIPLALQSIFVAVPAATNAKATLFGTLPCRMKSTGRGVLREV